MTTTTTSSNEPAIASGAGHAAPQAALAAERSEAVTPTRPRVLMLTHRLPYPPDRGDRIRSFHMLKLLSQHFDLAIASTSDEPVWLQHHQLLSTIAKRVQIQPISRRYSRLRGGLSLLRGDPITPGSFYRGHLARYLQHWHDEEPFDAVLTFCTGMIEYARSLIRYTRSHNMKTPRHVLDLVDVDSAKWRSYAQATFSPMRLVYGIEARRLRRIEAGRLDAFDAITVVSERERDVYQEQVGDASNVHVVGNGVDLSYFEPLPDTDAPVLAFVGVLNYRPNVDGVVWFVNRVMPELLKKQPDVQLLIIGRHPVKRVLELARCPGVTVVGSVPDVRVYMEQAAAMITPLQIARGVQNKVLEAMACSRVVVASPQAAAGVQATPGEHLLVAEDVPQWVEHLTSVLPDGDRRRAIARAARQQVETAYDWESRLMPIVSLLKGETPPQTVAKPVSSGIQRGASAA